MKYFHIFGGTTRVLAPSAHLLRERTGNRQQLELKYKGRPGQRVEHHPYPRRGRLNSFRK